MKTAQSRFILLSLVLHGLVLALGWWHNRDEQKPKKLPPVVMEIRQTPPAAAVPVAPAPLAATKKRAGQPSAQAGPTVAAVAPAAGPTQPALPAESFAPREIKTGGAIIAMRAPGAERGMEALQDKPRAFGDDGLNEQQRVTGRIGREVDAFMVKQHTAHGARGTAAALRTALRERFEPPAAYVASIPGSPAAAQQTLSNMMEAYKRPSAAGNMGQALVPAQQAVQAGMVPLSDPCAQSHEIGRRECRFRVDHDDDGQAAQVNLLLSSGDAAFDAFAANVIKQSTSTHLTRHDEEPQPMFSEWALSQIVYDWGFCAADRPPGKPVFPHNKSPFAVTYTSEVSLLSVRYRRLTAGTVGSDALAPSTSVTGALDNPSAAEPQQLTLPCTSCAQVKR